MSKEKVIIAVTLITGVVSIAHSALTAIRSINRMKYIASKTNYSMAICALQEVRRANEGNPEILQKCDLEIIKLTAASAAL